MNDTVVGVYYRPPDQDKEVDEAFYGQLEVLVIPWFSSGYSTALYLLEVQRGLADTVQEVPADTGR